MKQKTAMQLLIEKLKRMPNEHITNYLMLTSMEYLQKEKEQIVDAHVNGSSIYTESINVGNKDIIDAEDYYNQTYLEQKKQ